MKDRYDRNIRFFGEDGQKIIRGLNIVIVGIGGLGTHLVQQLAYLGIGRIMLIDPEGLDDTNLNRYIGAHNDDPIPGTRKVDLGERTIQFIDPSIQVQKIFQLCDQ